MPRKPTLAWSPEELEAETPAYQRLILREHERAVENWEAMVAWEKKQRRIEAEKKKQKLEGA